MDAPMEPMQSEAMLYQGLLPNVVTFCAVVSECRKSMMPLKVLQPFDEMQQHGLEPIGITYAAVTSPGGVTWQLSEQVLQQGSSQR